MKTVVERVLRSVRRLIPRGSRVLVAVSGGPDSVALFTLLVDLQRACGFTVAGIAHFNHQLRGAEADADEAFCRELARGAGVSFLSETADVRAKAAEWKASVEDAARRLRYDFLERARAGGNADVVAVGHTRDDQAETFLLRAARGAGARGLSGIREAPASIVRPLLDVGREDLHAWLRERGRSFRVDVTNQDLSFPRNRIRHEVLPALERVSPGATGAIARAARLASDDEDFLESRAIEASAEIVLDNRGAQDGAVLLDRARLAALPSAVARRVVRLQTTRVAPGRFVALKHVDAVLELTSGTLDLPGIVVEVDDSAGVIRLSPAAASGRARAGSAAEGAGSPGGRVNVFHYPLSIPGEVCVPESDVRISAQLIAPSTGGVRPTVIPGQALVSREAAADGLAVRNRRPGDRFRPVGLGGSKKLQDFFVDRKVPRGERDRVPLVVDGRDRIVWVVGHTIAEEFRTDGKGTGPEGAVLLLKVRHLGESV